MKERGILRGKLRLGGFWRQRDGEVGWAGSKETTEVKERKGLEEVKRRGKREGRAGNCS